jgi:glycosyltransferase involved in cell wall biosynthesis
MVGMKRYLTNILRYLDQQNVLEYCLVAPKSVLGVAKSHLWEQFRLPSFVKNNEFLWSPCQSGPITLKNQIVTIHDFAQIERPDLLADKILAHQWYKFMSPKLLRNAKRIIAVSAYAKKRAIELFGIPDSKIQVIYEAADEGFCRASDEKIVDVKKKYGIDDSDYILSLGSLDPRKNLKNLLQAWNNIRPLKKQNVRLVLAGKLHERLSYKELGLEQLPHDVSFTGYVDDEDLPALYSGAKMFVFPSVFEGFGLPPLEAMSCGTPVVASNVTSIPEICGDAAAYVDPLDVESIAEGIQAVLEDAELTSDLVEKGIKQVKKFSWAKAAEEHLAVFEQVITNDTLRNNR